MRKSFRWGRGPWALVVVTFLWISGCGETGPRGVVVVVVDTLRQDAVGAYGAGAGMTPNLDRLAADGVRYDSAISHASWTLPSTASLLTGLHPARHGAGGSWSGEFTGLADGVTTIAEQLRAAGIRTHGIANGAFLAPRFGLDRGFETYDFDAGSNLRVRRAERCVRDAIEWLMGLESQDSFFLYLHLFDPHLNYDPLPRYRGRLTAGYDGDLTSPFGELLSLRSEERELSADDRAFVRSLYGEEVLGVDAALGVLFDWMESSDWFDDTVVMVTSDHGEEFWEHGGFEHGHALHEELVRIPLLARYPEGCSGCVDSRQVSQVDVGATILDVFGMDGREELDGHSLLDEEWGSGAVPLAGLLYAPDGQRSGIRTERWKFVAWEDGRRALYDLRADPGETNDVSAQYPDTVSRFVEILNESPSATVGPSVVLDDEDRERLQALGYIQ